MTPEKRPEDLEPIERASVDELRGLQLAGRLDGLTVRVERRAGVEASSGAAGGDELARLVKNTIGVSVDVEVAAPDGVERSTGKMRRIVDLRSTPPLSD